MVEYLVVSLWVAVALVIVSIFYYSFIYFQNKKKKVEIDWDELKEKVENKASKPVKKSLSKVSSKIVTPKKEVKEASELNVMTHMKGYFAKKRVTKQLNQDNAMIIRMEFNSGKHRDFIVEEDPEDPVFKVPGIANKTYMMDTTLKYFNSSIGNEGMFCLDYHEGYNNPVRREIPLNDLRETVAGSGLTDMIYATNPKNINLFMDSKIIQQVISAASLGNVLKIVLIVLMIMGFVLIVDLIVSIYGSGILENIQGSKGEE